MGIQFKRSVLDPRLAHHDPEQAKYMMEKLIVVDEADQPLREGTKIECHVYNGRDPVLLHRAFSVFMFDEKGEKLLMQKRSAEKITYPNHWANTCCSHPLYTPEEMEEKDFLGVKRAAIRKLKHELGIEPEFLPIEDFHYVSTIHYYHEGIGGWGEHEIDHVLAIKIDTKKVRITPNPNEVAEIEWFNPEKLHLFINAARNSFYSDILISPWFSYINAHYLHKWWKTMKKDGIEAIERKERLIIRV